MEIPVRMIQLMNTNSTIVCDEVKQCQTIIPSLNQQQTLMRGQECCRPIISRYEDVEPIVMEQQVRDLIVEEQYRDLINEQSNNVLNKKWYATLNMEKEWCTPRTFNKFEVVKVKVNPIERVVIIKIVKDELTRELMIEPIRRVIRVPNHINIHQIKVHVLKEMKKVLITAPILRRECEPIMQQIAEREIIMEEMELMQSEPKLYKLLKFIQRRFPTFLLARGFRRCASTGSFKLCIDLTNTGFHAQEMQVMLKELERQVLIIKAERNLINQCRNTCQQSLYSENELEWMNCQPRTFYHELQFPTWCNMKQMTLMKLNETAMRMEIPIMKIEEINMQL